MDDKPSFRSISGDRESAEPAQTTIDTPAQKTESSTSKSVRDASNSSIPTKRVQRTPSTSNSPAPSRDSSPIRPPLKPMSRSTGPSRSRKNSVNEVIPGRSPSINTNPPSAAAQQRALSAATTPILHPVQPDPVIKAPIPQKPSLTSELKETPRWPISPRLKSPPPINKPSITSQRKPEHELPSINVQRPLTQTPEQQQEKPATNDSDGDDSLTIPGMRTPARGVSGASSTLETVQEISQPSTPAAGLGIDGAIEKVGENRLLEQDNPIDNAFAKTVKGKQNNESGSESSGKGGKEIKMKTTSAPPVTGIRPAGPATKSYGAATGAGRGKPSGGNMTVETETVSSIPQIAVGAGGVGNNGSIRTKPSSETIRPKKEKKKVARKTPSVTSGTASSKADIFEAKVASAVDEANSSDSEETFVYESNPPDANDRPGRFHSRTPSATSMASQVDQRIGPRSMMDGGHSVAMKKSMKFANSYSANNTPEITQGGDDGKGTARSNMGTGRGTTHHHHIGRWGRNGGNGHPSLFDNESPFPNASKSKLGGSSPRHSSQPTSPKPVNTRTLGNGRKSSMVPYDFDDGADDERTPLISSVRSGRSGRSRRPAASSIRQLEHQASRENRSFWSRFAGCLVLCLMILLVVSALITFLFATTQPLEDVKILALKNVLASEQDVILDMKVQARNPNIVVVTLDSTNLVIFAKSKYAGTDSEWWRRIGRGDKILRRGNRRDDVFYDPPFWPEEPDPTTNPNLEIGHVYDLDSPLIFEGSPFHHAHTTSTGQIRIIHPGNSTTPAGSERWGQVLQHDFELIVRGTLKYTLPLSQKLRSVIVEGRVMVKPNAADQDPDTVHII